MRSFYLHTKDTSYVIGVLESGHLEHLYYGRRIREPKNTDVFREGHIVETPNSIVYDSKYGNIMMDVVGLEYSGVGKGDFREPAIELYSEQNGYNSDFIYESHKLYTKAEPFMGHEVDGLPRASKEDVETLEITLKDKTIGTTLTMYYHVFYNSNVITRYVKVTNEGETDLKLHRVMSMQLDLPNEGYMMDSFAGEWTREMQRHTKALTRGTYVVDSKVGTSSSKHNPFIIVRKDDSNEVYGDCYGFNLIYSGNHAEIVEVGSFDKTRVLTGINPHCFNYTLQKGESFISPEAVMTYSHQGLNGMSQNMHKFVKESIIPKNFQYKERPILINNWEATYFDFNTDKLLELAKEASDVGVELFVLDDGWFGKRNDDKTSLGDWFVNEDKLKGGLTYLADKINELGMDFGLWVEPEMISRESELYKKHPEWAVGKTAVRLSEGRNQLVLDLTKREVCDYLVDTLTDVFESANIKYVKWDMNRRFSDMYGEDLGVDRQGEFFHRYMLGLYNVMGRLVEKFPDILFEGCAAGGNRFDLGILSYMPQIWGSDNTDGHERIGIQSGISYGYPVSTYGAHVSACPNHQTLRTTPIETRFNVAAFGLLGYELNLTELSELEKEIIKGQITFYKEHRKLLQFGEFYRLEHTDNKTTWMVTNEDRSEAILGYYQTLQKPNPVKETIKVNYLEESNWYEIKTRAQLIGEDDFGAMSKYLQDRNIEEEHIESFGDLLNYAGFKPKEQAIATTNRETIRVMGDFSSRLYTINKK